MIEFAEHQITGLRRRREGNEEVGRSRPACPPATSLSHWPLLAFASPRPLHGSSPQALGACSPPPWPSRSRAAHGSSLAARAKVRRLTVRCPGSGALAAGGALPGRASEGAPGLGGRGGVEAREGPGAEGTPGGPLSLLLSLCFSYPSTELSRGRGRDDNRYRLRGALGSVFFGFGREFLFHFCQALFHRLSEA